MRYHIRHADPERSIRSTIVTNTLPFRFLFARRLRRAAELPHFTCRLLSIEISNRATYRRTFARAN